MIKYIAFFLFTVCAFAQSTVDGGPRTLYSSPTNPLQCVIGQVFFKTGVAAGLNLYGCPSTNTWTLQSGAGAGAGTGLLLSGGNFIIDPTWTQTVASTIQGTCTSFVATGSATGSLVATASCPMPAYSNGQALTLEISDGASHGADTIQVGALGPIALKKISGGAVVAIGSGDMLQKVVYPITYNADLSPACFIVKL
jgi:hypothetical protein